MRRWHSCVLVLWIAIVVHLDWHLARPAHHRLSLAWPHHWLVAAAGFAVVGWIVARRWPHHPWRTAFAITGWGLLLGQGLEPVLELWFFHGRFGYPAEPGRWAAFFVSTAAGILALVAALALARRSSADA